MCPSPSFLYSHTPCVPSCSPPSSPQAAGITLTSGILLLSVAIAGYSAYLSFGYLQRIKTEGLGAVEGWSALQDFYEHTKISFAGAILAVVALQVGGWTRAQGGREERGREGGWTM